MATPVNVSFLNEAQTAASAGKLVALEYGATADPKVQLVTIGALKSPWFWMLVVCAEAERLSDDAKNPATAVVCPVGGVL
jgi:hypothetical protein